MLQVLTHTTDGDREPRVEVPLIINVVPLAELVARREDEDHALAVPPVLDAVFEDVVGCRRQLAEAALHEVVI
jgi:hypothetical protein